MKRAEIHANDVERTMSLKVPGMYSSALLIKTRDGRIYVENGNNLNQVQEQSPEHEYLQYLVSMKNPHVGAEAMKGNRLELPYGVFHDEGIVFEKGKDGAYFESNTGNTFRKLEKIEPLKIKFPETSEGYGIYGD